MIEKKSVHFNERVTVNKYELTDDEKQFKLDAAHDCDMSRVIFYEILDLINEYKRKRKECLDHHLYSSASVYSDFIQDLQRKHHIYI